MPLAAEDDLGLGNAAFCFVAKTLDTILADADDGEPLRWAVDCLTRRAAPHLPAGILSRKTGRGEMRR